MAAPTLQRRGDPAEAPNREGRKQRSVVAVVMAGLSRSLPACAGLVLAAVLLRVLRWRHLPANPSGWVLLRTPRAEESLFVIFVPWADLEGRMSDGEMTVLLKRELQCSFDT